MPSKKAYDVLLKHGIRVDRCHYCCYDSLATEEDLAGLFEVLLSEKDGSNNHPVMTANSVVANPDFHKIAANGFRKYAYEPFTTTLERYPAHSRSFALWQQGMTDKVFEPQFHGREHLNVNRWMRALRENMKETRLAFDYQLFGISANITAEKRSSYMAAFDLDDWSELATHKTILKEGFDLFRSLFNYSPESFVAPNGIIHPALEPHLASLGFRHLQSAILSFIPKGKGGYQRKIRYQGQKSKSGQCYTLRNCMFEPSASPAEDWVNRCLGQIHRAFRWQRPAVICSHRVNYVGFIHPKNRDNTLRLLKQLLQNICRRWPDVEFMSSAQLGKLILNGAS